ncbi:MAG: nucleotide-binding universal stress UspA family protein [Verrucomicrobiales bacterium]|jgi:nucleotide-binding universal stress UspA family protein
MKTSPIQRILVPLDATEHAEAATRLACSVAKMHSAKLEGLTVVDLEHLDPKMSLLDKLHWPAAHEETAKAIANAREAMAAVRAKFAETCQAEDVQHHEGGLTGLPATHILEVSPLYDLIVMGMRTFFHFEGHGVADSLAKVLAHTATPVLAAPNGEPTPIKNVLVTYDGSVPSGRALRDFAYFAEPFDFKITLFASHELEGHARNLLKNAGNCLKAHEITEFETRTTKRAPLEALEEENLLDGVDLVVAGIHSRGSVREAFVGSFTSELIDRGGTALFLSH